MISEPQCNAAQFISNRWSNDNDSLIWVNVRDIIHTCILAECFENFIEIEETKEDFTVIKKGSKYYVMYKGDMASSGFKNEKDAQEWADGQNKADNVVK